MSRPTLTADEARVLYFALKGEWITPIGCREFESGVAKLRTLGGGDRCRDCIKVGVHRSHLGGVVCDDHRHALDH